MEQRQKGSRIECNFCGNDDDFNDIIEIPVKRLGGWYILRICNLCSMLLLRKLFVRQNDQRRFIDNDDILNWASKYLHYEVMHHLASKIDDTPNIFGQ